MLSVYAGPPGSGKTFLANLFAKNYVESGDSVLFAKDVSAEETYGPYVDAALRRREPLLQVVSLDLEFDITIESRIRDNRSGVIILDTEPRGAGTGNLVQMQRRIETLRRVPASSNVFVFAHTRRPIGPDYLEEIDAPQLLSYSANRIYRISVNGPPEAREVRALCVKNRDSAFQGTAATYPINLSNLGISTPIVRPTISVALHTKMELIRLDLLELEAGCTLERRT